MLLFILRVIILIFLVLLPTISRASFIETTMGTAVVNDATAAYYNPAALMLLKTPQIIPLATVARFRTRFNGQMTTVATGFSQSGTSSSESDYYSGSLYGGLPILDRFTLGFAAVSNFANRSPEENSILRYVQSSNTIQDYDLVPSVGVRVNQWLSLGAGVNFSATNFNLQPIIGFPGSNVADSQSNNKTSGSGVGGNIGFLLQPPTKTLIGFNYRSQTSYEERGSSTLTGTQNIVSNNYHYTLRIPPRSVLSISQALSEKMGLITTVQRIQWSVIRNINIYGIATTTGTTPVIVNASVPYYSRNTWVVTVGGYYRFNPTWIVRAAATYNQSPNNGHYQMSTGDSYIVGASVGYTVNKKLSIEGSYAHAFIQDQSIDIHSNRNIIIGTNQASRDVVSLKLVCNI
jgi:long-chain fatty acid transport protein